MATFSVGEVAILCGDIDNPRMSPYKGEEVEILGPYDRIPTRNEFGYQITKLSSAKGRWYAFPQHLRKKHPPQETVAWEDCVWRPEHVT